MAIQVGGTTVIDNSRNLSNIPIITTTKIAETYVDLGSAISGTVTINLNSGTVFRGQMSGNTTFSVSNAATASSFILMLYNNGAGYSVAWSGGTFRFPGGSGQLNRTTGTGGWDVWGFATYDAGSNWWGNIVMRNMS